MREIPSTSWFSTIAARSYVARASRVFIGFVVIAFFVLWPKDVVAQSREPLRFSVGDSCGPGKISLTMRDGIALAHLTINQKPMTFIVDSAGTTIINSDRVELPVVKELKTAPVTISTNDVLDFWKVVYVQSFGFGKAEIRHLEVLSRSMPHLEAQLKTEVDGILGADVLVAWDSVSLDYRRKALILEGAHCGEVQPQSLRGFNSGTTSLRRD